MTWHHYQPASRMVGSISGHLVAGVCVVQGGDKGGQMVGVEVTQSWVKVKRGEVRMNMRNKLPPGVAKSNLDAFALGAQYYILNDVINTDMFFCFWILVQERPVYIRLSQM